jgi:UDP-GlcNAc:undecaprenyl-phosphate GlcNAc-1-phosphate transferase
MTAAPIIPGVETAPPPIDAAATEATSITVTMMGLLNSYAHIFVVAFITTLLLTPLAARVAFALNVIDRPDAGRKGHERPVAYLGGLAVFLGLVAALGVSYVTVDRASAQYAPMPIAVIIGMMAIMLTGLADDVRGWDPRLKIAGQLVAAAALAINDIGVRVAEGMLGPVLGEGDAVLMAVGGVVIQNGDVYYWMGTALIAFFVLGGCNAANLIDGLDGLLSGVVAIVAAGLLAVCLVMAADPPTAAREVMAAGQETLDGARIVLCVALLGAVLGFLPHNFNPASIFLGDCGSLLIGFSCVTIILMMGEHGQTHLVFAGLIIFAVPIIDTTLAIIRRWLAGTPMSAGDDQHMHHQLKRSLGGVKRAVMALYGISLLFAVIGVSLAWLVMQTELRVRVIYAIALVLFSFTGVIAVKAARRHQRLAAARTAPSPAASASAPPVPTPPPARPEPARPG